MSSFDYRAPAELFLAKPMKGSRTKYWRFTTAAEALRYAVEDLRTPKAFGAWLEVGDERFDDDFGGVAAGNAERRCGRTGQERYDAELHVGSCRGGLLSLSWAGPEMHQSRGRNPQIRQTPACPH